MQALRQLKLVPKREATTKQSEKMTQKSSSLLVNSLRYANKKQRGLVVLRDNLPKDALRYFTLRKSGNYWGISNICPFCGEKPPRDIKPWNRRRWQAVHISTHVKGY